MAVDEIATLRRRRGQLAGIAEMEKSTRPVNGDDGNKKNKKNRM